MDHTEYQYAVIGLDNDSELLKLMDERRQWFTSKEDGSFVTDFNNPEVIEHIMGQCKENKQ